MSKRISFRAILRTLATHRVDLVVIGGFGAYAHGSGILTKDVDIVHSRDPENVRRLMAALAELKAVYRMRRDLSPGESHLMSPRHQLLVTEHGELDILGSAGEGFDYESLVGESELTGIGEGLSVRIANLDALIRMKEEAGRDKDRAVLPILRSLRERNKRG